MAHFNGNMKVKWLIPIATALCITICQAQGERDDDTKPPEATGEEFELPFWDISDMKGGFIDPTPENRQDGLEVGSLGGKTGNRETMIQLGREIAAGRHGNFDGLLIVHKGQLVFESYYLKGRVDLPHPQASATKAYTSFAVGRAIQLGYLSMDDLDKPLISFLEELDRSRLVAGAEKITLHHALTMRSGIRLTREQRDNLELDSTRVKGQGQVQAYLEDTKPITEESQVFEYKFDPMLVMQVLEAVVPGSAKDFIKRELLDKLGITNYGWQTDVSGLPKSGSRSSLTARDMMKWGLLAANDGKWNGEQLIPKSYVNKAINRIVTDSEDENFDDYNGVSNIGYGYYWWQADLEAGGTKYFSTSAQGGSGQMIILIEELDLIVVTTVHRLEIRVLQLVADRILPAFI